MHSLTELKELFETVGIEIVSFNGMFLYTAHGKWGMFRDEYYLNGQMITRKHIKELA